MWVRRARRRTIWVTRRRLIVTGMGTGLAPPPHQRTISAIRQRPTETVTETPSAHRRLPQTTWVTQPPFIVTGMETGQAQTGRIRTTWGIRTPPILTLTAIRGAVRQLRRTIWAIPPRTTRTSMVIREAHPPHRQIISATGTPNSAVTIVIPQSGVGKSEDGMTGVESVSSPSRS